MDSTRWERIQTLFHDVADLPALDQRVFLKTACGDDVELAADVLALVAEDASGASLLDRDLAQVANEVLDEVMPASLPFQEFGPYRMKQVLGEGGMGVVYLAERTDLGTLVAIKILRDAWLSPARRERFASEQRTLAQLNHPSIARLYDADTLDDGTPWFVMEYVEGIPLTDYCSEHASSVEDRLHLFRAVCEAVQYAHQHAVIHRDLKPSNILVKPDGTIRLLDFGIAKQVASLEMPLGKSDQTMTGLRLMTPAYAAPEQIRGDRVGIHTDVYALGVILYELLAGELPFDLSRLTPGEAEAMIVGQDPERPSVVAGRMADTSAASVAVPTAGKIAWADLDVLCLTAMHKDVQRRYQSVEALMRDIDHYLQGEPLEARPDSFRYRLGKFVRRNRRAVSAAVVVFTIVVVVVIFFTVRLAKARNAALAEAARTQRIQKFMTNLFQGGDEAAGPADSLRVVTLLDRGVQEAQSLSPEPEIQAQLYATLGTLYENLGKFDQANSLLNSALAERKSLFGPDNAQVAESLVALGVLRDQQAQLPEAENLVREGLAMSKRHLPPNHPAVAKATTALGKVLEDRGAYESAIQTLDEAVRLQSTKGGAATPELAASLYELANTHFYAGHYDKAEALNQRLLPIYRQIYGERHPRVADVLINLGAIRHDLGHYSDAEQFERQALDIVQAWYGKDNPATASDLTILARTLVFENHYDEGIGLLQQSLAIKERVYGKVHPSVASSLNELGNAAFKQGNYDAAEQYFTRMADIYRAIYGDHHYLLGIALSNLAGVYMGRQEWSRAENLFRQVIPLFTETQSAHHINTGIARTKLGRTLLREHRYPEAEAESRAGYDILVTQMDPKVSWLVKTRQDLVEEYVALHQPEKAAQFQIEVADAEKPLDASKK
jgi:serine/threonine protein kinase/tetratricopeptide (TPR) repeat protein